MRGKRRRAMRVIHDPKRYMVLVYELEPVPGDPGQRTLVFEWGKSSAELESYPAQWQDLSDAGLLALLSH